MAAIDTFNWWVREFYPAPDEDSARSIRDQRMYLQSIRNEDQRSRYLEELIAEAHELKKKKARV